MFRRLRNFFGWYTDADNLFYREERVGIDREKLTQVEEELATSARELNELRCHSLEEFLHKRMMMDYLRKRRIDIDQFRAAIEHAEARIDHDRIYGVHPSSKRVIMNQRK